MKKSIGPKANQSYKVTKKKSIAEKLKNEKNFSRTSPRNLQIPSLKLQEEKNKNNDKKEIVKPTKSKKRSDSDVPLVKNSSPVSSPKSSSPKTSSPLTSPSSKFSIKKKKISFEGGHDTIPYNKKNIKNRSDGTTVTVDPSPKNERKKLIVSPLILSKTKSTSNSYISPINSPNSSNSNKSFSKVSPIGVKVSPKISDCNSSPRRSPRVSQKQAQQVSLSESLENYKKEEPIDNKKNNSFSFSTSNSSNSNIEEDEEVESIGFEALKYELNSESYNHSSSPKIFSGGFDLSNLDLNKIKSFSPNKSPLNKRNSLKIKQNPIYGRMSIHEHLKKQREESNKQSEKFKNDLKNQRSSVEEYMKKYEKVDNLTIKLKEERLKEALKNGNLKDYIENQKQKDLNSNDNDISSIKLKLYANQKSNSQFSRQPTFSHHEKTKKGEETKKILNPLMNFVIERKKSDNYIERTMQSASTSTMFISDESTDSSATPRTFFSCPSQIDALSTESTKISDAIEEDFLSNSVVLTMSLSPRGNRDAPNNFNRDSDDFLYHSSEFSDYLKSVYAHEILLFWFQVKEYKSCTNFQQRFIIGLNIYQTFIHKESDSESSGGK